MKTWQCGDCGRVIPKSETSCGRFLDDYLSLRGGSIESAITQAVDKAIAPIVKRAEHRLCGGMWWQVGTTYSWLSVS